jgi:hypothetical protein
LIAPDGDEPLAGYDGMKTDSLMASLPGHSQTELVAIQSYERTHRNRKAVMNKLRRLRVAEPRLPKDKGLSSEGVTAALRRARARRATQLVE